MEEKKLLSPGAKMDLPMRKKEDSLLDLERNTRELYVHCLNAIAYRIMLKGDDGEYAYFVPAIIEAGVEVEGWDARISLRCTEEGWKR